MYLTSSGDKMLFRFMFRVVGDIKVFVPKLVEKKNLWLPGVPYGIQGFALQSAYKLPF